MKTFQSFEIYLQIVHLQPLYIFVKQFQNQYPENAPSKSIQHAHSQIGQRSTATQILQLAITYRSVRIDVTDKPYVTNGSSTSVQVQ